MPHRPLVAPVADMRYVAYPPTAELRDKVAIVLVEEVFAPAADPQQSQVLVESLLQERKVQRCRNSRTKTADPRESVAVLQTDI